jgi:serine/threonine protein kinase
MTDPIAADAGLSPVDRIAEMWDAAGSIPPDLHKLLASCGSLAARDVADILLVDQRYRWQTGQGIPAETYLSQWPDVAADRDLRSDLVYGEFRARAAQGKPPEWKSFVERFPDLRETLARQAEVSRWLGEALPTAGSDLAALTSGDDLAATTKFALARTGPVSTAFDPRAPLPFSDFQLRKRLGAGGMGEVFEALQLSLNKLVALKILKSFLADARSIERFLHEARSVAGLRHPHIVDVHGIGRCDDGRYFLVMDLMPGGNLADRINTSPATVAEIVEIIRQIAGAIAHANSRGVIHRDLKPSNVLLDADGQALVADFGLARSENAGLSTSGDILGTPQYMAPEQADDRYGAITAATDVYGVGAVFYSLLTGQAPFSGASAAQIVTKVISEETVADPRDFRSDIPVSISAICLKCLRKEPSERYGSAQEIVAALEACQRLNFGLCAPGSASELRNSCLDRPATKNTGKASGTLNSSCDNALEAWKPAGDSRSNSPSANRSNDWRFQPQRWQRRSAGIALAVLLLAMAALLALNRVRNNRVDPREDNSPDAPVVEDTSGSRAAGQHLSWTVDVYRQGKHDDRVRITSYPAPVFNGDQLRLQLLLTKPAHIYCYWLGADGVPVQLFPPDQAADRLTEQITIPTNHSEGLPIEGRPGAEICLVLLRAAVLPSPADFLEQLRATPPPAPSKLDTVLADGLPILETLSAAELRSQRPDLAGPLSRIPAGGDSRNIGAVKPLVPSATSDKFDSWLRRLPTGGGEAHYLVIPHVPR